MAKLHPPEKAGKIAPLFVKSFRLAKPSLRLLHHDFYRNL